MNKTCEGFQLDIMDYAGRHMEHLTHARQKELVSHIIKCPDCRKDFLDTQNIFTLVIMQAETEESKQKMADFIKKLISESGDKKQAPSSWRLAADRSKNDKKKEK